MRACHEHPLSHCVCRTVKRISDAQNEAARRSDCESGCEQSIRDLLGPARRHEKKKTTIPFILYCQGDCKPFIARGVSKTPIDCYPDTSYYRSVKTPFLKVKKVDAASCCAHVELLRPVNANGYPVASDAENFDEYFSERTPFRTIHFQETGICLTLDLKCFCAITCLDAVSTLSRNHTLRPINND